MNCWTRKTMRRERTLSKEEITAKLNEMGYKSRVCADGMIYIDTDVKMFPKLKKLLKELGYKGSYAVRKEKCDG